MNRTNWYFSRLRTMTVREAFYRSAQLLQKQLEKTGRHSIDHSKQDYGQLLNRLLQVEYEPIPAQLCKEFCNYNTLHFFGAALPVTAAIDWHLDIMSGSRFPLSFSKDIDIRFAEYGSAKVVWEINRLQFLLPLALKYSYSRNPEDLQLFITLSKSWIEGNAYLQGINWYSNIEVNIRLMVWYFCWQVLMQVPGIKEDTCFTEFAQQAWLPCIYEHCVYSYRNPSKYSSANNHAASEYAGLFVASAFWPFKESKEWNVYARNGLEKEIQLQHSKEGINKEEAAEYIQLITDLFLIPYAVGKKRGIDFSTAYSDTLFRICTYIFNLLDAKGNYCKYGDEDDGRVLITSADLHFNNFKSILMSGAILFNSSAFKWVAGNCMDVKNCLLWGAAGEEKFESIRETPVTRSSFFATEEGHFIFKKQTGAEEVYGHFDVAPLGYLSIAAHGHADALSFCLHVDGCPFIADPGTYTYHTEPEWRKYFVSTLAHNTICIDGKDQAQHVADTLWLKHYTCKVLDVATSSDTERVTGMHDGYKHLGCVHKRTVIFNKNKDVFTIEDEVIIHRGARTIAMPFNLHPAITVKKTVGNTWVLEHANCSRHAVITLDSKLDIQLVKGNEQTRQGWFSPSFLVKQPCLVLTGIVTASQTVQLKTTIEIKK